MSSIPGSVMPHAVAQVTDDPPIRETGALSHAVRIATAPAIVALGLSAMVVSAVADILAAQGSPVATPSDQVPI